MLSSFGVSALILSYYATFQLSSCVPGTTLCLCSFLAMFCVAVHRQSSPYTKQQRWLLQCSQRLIVHVEILKHLNLCDKSIL